MSKTQTIEKIAQSDEPFFERGCKVSAMFHSSKELGTRHIHNPTRMEGVEFNLQTVEIVSHHNQENIKSLGKIVKDLIDQNTFQQEQIGKLMVRIQELEAKA